MEKFKIYYATMTGNSEALASELLAKASEHGLDPVIVDLGEIDPVSLMSDEHAVFIVSTWGEGEPPDDADEFWGKMEAAPFKLDHLRYSIFGLGDTGYQYFNGFAKALDARLQEMEAVSVVPRVDADIDYDDHYAAWESSVLTVFSGLRKASVGGAIQ